MAPQKSNSKVGLLLFAAWVVATVATLGSLFFSQVMQLPPCVLCWYQRICMYPLTLLFAVAVLKPDAAVLRYASPLVVVGWAIAAYHNLLYFGFISEEVSPCQQGVPCTAMQLEWLGFITIPLLSLTAFSLLGILLFSLRNRFEQ
jgi:disulfide bond formation protein DsbB